MNSGKKINLYKNLYENVDDYKRNLYPMYRLINSCMNKNIQSMLDYGCGEGNLADLFKLKKNILIYKYDPAIAKYSKLDKNLKVDLVTNCDVMEHIPEDEIDNILREMSNISKNIFFNIYLTEAKTFLPNGENAHCTIKPKKWWLKKIRVYFPYSSFVFTSYKNSTCIITWKISLINRLYNFLFMLVNRSEFVFGRILSLIR